MLDSNDVRSIPEASISQRSFKFSLRAAFVLEWLLIILLAYLYSGTLLNFDAMKLQQTGEQNPSSILPILAEIGLQRYQQIPLWNPYMMTGLPHAGDLFNHFWHPVSTIPILLWGGINGFKVSVFLTFIVAGLGQWVFARLMGLRRVFRLWSSILFMISGGLVMYWRVGWYALLLGIVWFPWCFASLLHALQTRTLRSIIFASLAIYMVISAASGYHPVYLAVSLAILTIVVLLRAKPNERAPQMRTAALVVLLSAALSAIVIVPYIDGLRYAPRDIAPDLTQSFSQPIQYGIINYVIHTPDWFGEDVLGTGSGWNWYYIGWLPIAGLAFVPLAFSRLRRMRWPILITGILFFVLMMWFANRYSPLKQVYDWLPFLYALRFPNRLLIVASIPLLILSALGLEYIYRVSIVGGRDIKLVNAAPEKKRNILSANWVVSLLWLVGLFMTTKQVYDVNKGFAFADQSLNPQTFTVLRWLKSQDPSLYYVHIGGVFLYWDWTPAAYTLEMPVINFQHARHIQSWDQQHAENSPFVASAKYQISLPHEPVPPNAVMIKEIDGLLIWHNLDALPYAFSLQPSLLQTGDKLAVDQVTALNVSLDGPNRIVVRGSPKQEGDALIVLMSAYPGWKLLIDGKPAQLTPYNHYLGTSMPAGEHVYTFYFMPEQFIVGAAISAMTLVGILAFTLYSPVKSAIRKFRQRPTATPHLKPVR